MDIEHLQQWLSVERDRDEYRRFLDHHIYDVSGFEEYLERSGGRDRMPELRRLEFLEDG